MVHLAFIELCELLSMHPILLISVRTLGFNRFRHLSTGTGQGPGDIGAL